MYLAAIADSQPQPATMHSQVKLDIQLILVLDIQLILDLSISSRNYPI